MPIDSEIPRLQSRHRKAMQYFDYINKESVEACIQVLEPEDIRQEFDTAFKRFAQSMDMIMPNPKAQRYIADLKFLGKVQQLAKSRYREELTDISDCGEKVKRLIAEHLRASSIQVVHDPINILSNRFDEELKKKQSEEAKASEMEHAIKHEIKIKLDENPVFYTSLRERLEQLIQARKDKQMEIQDLIEGFNAMIGELRSLAEKSEAHGLEKEQFPFYQLLETELPGEEQVAKDLTEIITAVIQQQAVVEWKEKDEVKRQMRREIKKHLRASRFPADRLEGLTQQMMDLARIHYG